MYRRQRGLPVTPVHGSIPLQVSRVYMYDLGSMRMI